MKLKNRLFAAAICSAFAVFTTDGFSTCQNSDLIRCLDSVCSGNIGMNPAVRCQLCGTSQSGVPDGNGMKSISIGASNRNTLSNTELKSAPNDPGKRYAWATGECIKKISGCTADDVSNNYDKLIEQSCRAAGINAEINSIASTINKLKTDTVCISEISLCITGDKSCGADFDGCSNDSDFDKFFAACAANANGCDNSITVAKSTILNDRESAITGRETTVSNIIKSYQTQRENNLKSANDSCENNNGREECIKTACQNNMKNKCAVGFESEKSMAILLCKFYDTACDGLK